MRIILRNIFTMFILLGAVSNVSAALIIESGQLIGATNVDVDGTLYNVEFIDSSCFTLLDGCNEIADFQFNTIDLAGSASEALLALFANNPVYGDTPALTRGCEHITSCFIWTFYWNEVTSLPHASIAINHGVNSQPDNITGTGNLFFLDFDFTFAPADTIALWTQATSVAEPSLMVIWGLGLIGLASRRFKKQS
jgi:hypothetical protein